MNQVLIPRLIAPPAIPRGLPVHSLAGATMGTTWSVRCVTADDPAHLRAAIEARLDDVDREMSGWRAASDLSRFNRLPPGGSALLPDGFRTVLGCALEVAAATAGAFDPTIGALVDLWGFGPVPAAQEGPPPPAAIAAALARTGWRRLALDARTGALLQPGGVSLDLSGIAKGYAVDLVAEALQDAGIDAFLVEIGGELRGHGVKPDGTPWWVGIEAPGDPAPQGSGYLVALHGLAIATSGDYRRGFTHDGVLYGHALDPRTGWPAAPAIAAVTVLDPSCMRADALATALTVLGAQAGPDHAARHGIAALFAIRDGAGSVREHLSPGLAAMLD